ncbi:MAG: hypothetical protein KDA73_07695 [Rhodobacteraceae bacterium]|nr:hypothetical protein [Paracoccaceae bacterium]
MRVVLGAALISLAVAGAAAQPAEDRSLTLAADARLEASGFLGFLVPRFALKTGLRVAVRAGDAEAVTRMAVDGTADVVLVPDAVIATIPGGAEARVAFRADDAEAGDSYLVAVPPNAPRPENGVRFFDWLLSEIGQNTVAQFVGRDGQRYVAAARDPPRVAAVLPDGDRDEGERLAKIHCGRCHVVSASNPFGGNGSAPSFPALRSFPDWQQRFREFWSENPHPSFTEVEGQSAPLDPDSPRHITPVVIDWQDLDAILAYVARIAPKDLGARVQPR